MKYKVRLTAPEIREFTLNKNYLFTYSERMVYWLPTREIEVFASIKDAETLQRLNPQHEVDIWSTYDECYLPLWFFRKYEDILFRGIKMPTSYYIYTMWFGGTPYEPSHPIVSQAPKFVYQPSQKFLNKKASLSVERMFGWKQVEYAPLTVSKLQEYLTDIFVRRNNKERKQIKIGIYCPHVGHWITVGPNSWPCSECYYERIGKHLYEQAQNYLKADKYYGKTNKA